MTFLCVVTAFVLFIAHVVGDTCSPQVGKSYDRGPDIGDIDTNDTSTCCAECLADPMCLAWTYDASSTKTKSCRLKGGDGVKWGPVDARLQSSQAIGFPHQGQ